MQKTGDLRAEIAAHLQVMVDTQFREHLGERGYKIQRLKKGAVLSYRTKYFNSPIKEI